MLKAKTVRLLLWAPLLGGALLISGCEGTQVGVGLGFSVATPWAPVGVVGPSVGVGWYGGGGRWYP